MRDFEIFPNRVEKTHAWGKSIIYTKNAADAFTAEELETVIAKLQRIKASLTLEQQAFLTKLEKKLAAAVVG